MKNIALLKDLDVSNFDVILFGEVHGTKEIPNYIFSYISDCIKNFNLDIGLELSSSYQDKVDLFLECGDENILAKIFLTSEADDGRKTEDYFLFIKKIRQLNIDLKKKIRVICLDVSDDFKSDDFQNNREKIIANNILLNNRGKLCAVLGNIHASRKEINFSNLKINPVGSILSKKLKDKLLTINIVPKKGKFYNFSIKEVEEIILSPPELYDIIYIIDEVTPSRPLILKTAL